MDNRTIYVSQAVDKTIRIRVKDKSTGQRVVVGLPEGCQAEVNFKRANGEDVGRLTSAVPGHFEFRQEAAGVEEAILMTFQGETTERWELKPEKKDIFLNEDNWQVVLGDETIFGKLLVRDGNGADVRSYSGIKFAVVMETSTTLGFTPASVDTDNDDG